MGMSLELIDGRIWANTSGSNAGNHGAIILEDEILLVDAGMFHTVSLEIRDFLENKFELPIRKLLLTHYHRDHVFGAQAFGNAEMISSIPTRRGCLQNLETHWKMDNILEEAEKIKDDRPLYYECVQDLKIKVPDVGFTGSAIFGKNDEIVFRHVGGHTAGSSIVIVEPEHIIYVGDLIFNGTFPYAGDPSCNPDDWISALEEIHKDDYLSVIPGHGAVCGNDEISEHIELLRELRSKIIQGISDGLTPTEFIEKGLVPDYHIAGAEGRVQSSVEKWFDFYRK